MTMTLHLSCPGLDLTPDETSFIEEAARGLEHFFPRLLACQVVVTVPHHMAGQVPVAWVVRLSLTVPRAVLVVNRQARPSLRQALDDAFSAARRQLQDYARETRGDVKHRSEELQGVVTRLNGYEGYGFLTGADGEEVYFSRNSLPEGGFDRLSIGDRVRFVETEGEKGPQASTVVVLAQAASGGGTQ